MTKREVYTNMSNGTLTPEMIEWGAAELAKLDASNEKRRNAPSKTAVANEPYVAAVKEMVGIEPLTASDIAAKLNELFTEVEKPFTPQKATALARTACKEGGVNQIDVKIPKKGVQKGYVKAE